MLAKTSLPKRPRIYVPLLIQHRLRRIKQTVVHKSGPPALDLKLAVRRLQQEIGERKKVERALRRSERRQRKLVRQYMAWQENERKLLAQEIHDSIGGNLATIKYALEEKLEGMSGTSPGETVSIEKIIELVQSTVADTRRLAAKLRPSVLDDLGLTCAIESYCREYEAFHNMKVLRQIDLGDSQISSGAQIVIYRILQEAMANAAKHSGAACLTVRLKQSRGIELSIADDGCGFDPAAVTPQAGSLSGYGLRGMRDRALISGGALEIDSKPGNGTRIRLRIPSRIEWDCACSGRD